MADSEPDRTPSAERQPGASAPTERAREPGGGLLMGRVLGVPVYVGPSWFLVAALIVPGSELGLREVGINRARIGLLSILSRMGVEMGGAHLMQGRAEGTTREPPAITVEEIREPGPEPIARLNVRSAPLRGAAITADDAGDLNTVPAESEEDAEYAEADMLRLSKARLPTEIVFAAGDVAAVPQMAAAAANEAGGWSRPILFYPDGTTSDATVVVANADKETVRVTLRGLTGISRAGDVAREDIP